MSSQHIVWMYFFQAGPVVKTVMLILLAASIASWTFIIQRALYLKQAKTLLRDFEKQFWAGQSLTKLFNRASLRTEQLQGSERIFHAGFSEFIRLQNQQGASSDAILDGAQRAMRIAYAHETDQLENHLAFLASVGSSSPYIGLFGTVWGIMTSFHALGQVQQATIAMVAPGISEALIATAMGLFAAIPAVLAYNRYANDVERLMHSYVTFQEEFHSILHRQVHDHNPITPGNNLDAITAA